MSLPARTRATATSNTVSRVNQTAIIEALRDRGPLSRQQIGTQTGLSPATVNRLTGVLIDEGLVVNAGRIPSTGGRPSALLRYTGSSRIVAALQVRADCVRGALIDFDGEFIYRSVVSFADLIPVDAPANIDHDQRLARTLALCDELLATAETMGKPCVSVGLTVPGVVRHPEGSIAHLPELGWPEFSLGALLSERIALPFVIENDANALAVGELRHGAARGVDNLVAVHLENGFGAGIVTNGQLHRGARFEAGEIGYLLIEPSSLSETYPHVGDLEGRVGSLALTRIARERGIHVADGHLLMADEIFTLAKSGDEVAKGMTSALLDMVAMAIGALSVVLDPQLIVLGSGLAANADMTIPAIAQRLSGRIIRVPSLVPATFNDDGVLVGIGELAALEVRGLTYVAK